MTPTHAHTAAHSGTQRHTDTDALLADVDALTAQLDDMER